MSALLCKCFELLAGGNSKFLIHNAAVGKDLHLVTYDADQVQSVRSAIHLKDIARFSAHHGTIGVTNSVLEKAKCLGSQRGPKGVPENGTLSPHFDGFSKHLRHRYTSYWQTVGPVPRQPYSLGTKWTSRLCGHAAEVFYKEILYTFDLWPTDGKQTLTQT